MLKSPMTERMSTYSQTNVSKRGIPTKHLIELYRVWGQGRIGLIIIGNTPIAGDHLEAPANPVLGIGFDEPERIEAFKKLISAAKSGGSVVMCQITHSGRQCYKQVNPTPIAPSSVPITGVQMPGVEFGTPKEATKEDIEDIIEKFSTTAKILYDIGCDGVELHGAHGYLLSSFLQPYSNRRTDEYGGSLENRARIIFRIIDRIREKVTDPKFILGIKLNSQDFREDSGMTPDESKQICKWLDEKKVDLIELSGGSYEKSAFVNTIPNSREAYFVEYAERVRKEINNSVIAVTGGFRSAKAMTDAISSGSTHIVGLARPLCLEPHLCKDILEKKVASAKKTLTGPKFGLPLAGAQLTAIGYGEEPYDASNEESAKKFEKIFSEYAASYGTDRPDKAGIAGFMRVAFENGAPAYGISQPELIVHA